MTDRYVCIHGHFYQPPRENPWLEAVEVQDSASPYHDWNTRITAECYAPNATSRILDDAGNIAQITNNYVGISFNFGPTLLSWLEVYAPRVYRAVIEADDMSRHKFGGHGSAIAMPYNHMILPLANRRDKYTQIVWGLADFQHRFGRPAEGIWLPETAVDLESLDMAAELGIRFTILSPHQAAKVRPLNRQQWTDADPCDIDTTRTYRIRLPSGRHMALFFYDAPISHAVAFENLLQNGEKFAHRLMEGFRTDRQGAQLVHVVTDGETYGHHQQRGDMALAYALDLIETNGWPRLTNYGQFLEMHPPAWEVLIHEGSSWSCPHGIARWREDCGCRSGRFPQWQQAWRRPLRDALDWLRDFLAPAYEKEMGKYLKDPWKARNDYIGIVLDRSEAIRETFFHRHAKSPLAIGEDIRLLKLLEMQRHTLLMYTSCGWFFDDLSGIETVQILQYAGRAVQIAADILGEDPEPRFLSQLAEARSNLPQFGDGRRIYERFVRQAMVDLEKVAAHYAISSLFEHYAEKDRVFCYSVRQYDYQWEEAGKVQLAVGHINVTSRISLESSRFYFGLLHFGDHNMACGVSTDYEEGRYRQLWQDLRALFQAADLPNILKHLDDHFKGAPYSIKSLFRDNQRRIVDLITDATVNDLISVYRHMYAPNVQLMRFLKDSGSHPPRALYNAAELVLNHDLYEAFRRKPLDLETIRYLLEEADLTDISLHADNLEFTLRSNLEELADRFGNQPEDYELLDRLTAEVEFVDALPFDVNLRKVQDICFGLMEGVLPDLRRRATSGDRPSVRWIRRFRYLGEKLHIRVD